MRCLIPARAGMMAALPRLLLLLLALAVVIPPIRIAIENYFDDNPWLAELLGAAASVAVGWVALRIATRSADLSQGQLELLGKQVKAGQDELELLRGQVEADLLPRVLAIRRSEHVLTLINIGRHAVLMSSARDDGDRFDWRFGRMQFHEITRAVSGSSEVIVRLPHEFTDRRLVLPNEEMDVLASNGIQPGRHTLTIFFQYGPLGPRIHKLAVRFLVSPDGVHVVERQDLHVKRGGSSVDSPPPWEDEE